MEKCHYSIPSLATVRASLTNKSIPLMIQQRKLHGRINVNDENKRTDCCTSKQCHNFDTDWSFQYPQQFNNNNQRSVNHKHTYVHTASTWHAIHTPIHTLLNKCLDFAYTTVSQSMLSACYSMNISVSHLHSCWQLFQLSCCPQLYCSVTFQ